MGKPVQLSAVVVKNQCLTGQVFEMILQAGEIAEQAKAGQFISIYCKEGSRLLPRPISICGIHREKKELRLVFRIAGEGTKEFSEWKTGEKVDITGPLGNGFDLTNTKDNEHYCLFGGGIGIPPMLELAKSLPGKKTIYLGYRDKDAFLSKEFEAYGEVKIASDDGSIGTKGNVLDAWREDGKPGDLFFACGPKPMLRGIKQAAEEKGIRAQISLEERMACGIGACLGCVCKTVKKDEHSQVNNTRICKEGPVFYADTVEI